MASARKHRLYKNLSTLQSETLFTGDGVILGVNARWIGYTKTESERSFVLGGVHVGFTDGDGVRPLGEDETNQLFVPYGNAFYYTNPHQSSILSLIPLAEGSIVKIHKPTARLMGQFNGSLTFQAISEFVDDPHSVDLDIEVYLFDT